MIVLAIDLGSKRIGLAISDPGGTVALPAGALESRGEARDVAALCAWMRERGVERAVVGLPVHMDGRIGPEAEAARRFAARLARASGVAVATLDERWTTVEAERTLAATGRRGRKRRAVVDSVAATLLLSTFLERERGARREEGP